MVRSRQPPGTESGEETASPARDSVKRRQSVLAHAGTPCNSAVAHPAQAIVTYEVSPLACKLHTLLSPPAACLCKQSASTLTWD